MNEYKALTEFYPTPPELIAKMIKDVIGKNNIETILEPSAGKGDIIDFIRLANDYLYSSRRYSVYKKESKVIKPKDLMTEIIEKDTVEAFKKGERSERYNNIDINCVEIDKNLCTILKSKNYQVQNEDFLNFNDDKHYDLIIMNPPFSNGDEHLLKAISIAKKTGSKIVCLLNAETIRNPYSNRRKELLKQLDKYNATYEYISNSFLNAERKTDVEVVIVKFEVPSPFGNTSKIWEELENKDIEIDESGLPTEIISADDTLKMAVKMYQRELEAGKRLIEEYMALKPYLSSSFENEDTPSYMKGSLFVLSNGKNEELKWNDYLYSLRYKYWYQLLHNPKFIKNLTSNLKDEYNANIKEFANKDFSLKNIYTVKMDILKRTAEGIEDKIVGLFEKLSYEHSLGCEKNVHYFNGWASNSAFKINKKVVVPYMKCWDSFWNKLDYTSCTSNLFLFLDDIEKCLDFLSDSNDKNDYRNRNLLDCLKYYEKSNQTKNLCFKHFDVDVFKKGTVHIKFRDEELLKRFNIYGCRHKGWLPPSYGKKSYKDMDEKEKHIIDEYEGKEEYNKVYNNPTNYIIAPENQILMLGA